MRDVRVYDPISFQLIVFESHQRKAIQYKIAVANLAWAYMNGQLKPSKWSLRGDLVSAGRQILSLPCGCARGELVRDLAEREGCSLATAYRRIAKATGKRLRDTRRRDRGSTRYPEEKRLVIQYSIENPQAAGNEIRAALGIIVSAATIDVWLRK